ncbi:MAG: patatin-like phospholipase family protein [Spirochaetales bacterium]
MTKLGLVLAGGGGKGAYQIGVWKYFRECGLEKKISAYSGTSVGALNASLMMLQDYETAEYIWLNQIKDKILPFNKENITTLIESVDIAITNRNKLSAASHFIQKIQKHGLCSRDGMRQIIKKYVDVTKISHAKKPIFATCFSNSSHQVKYFPLNNKSEEFITQVLCATSAIPFIFGEEQVLGTGYSDGGIPLVGDNVPIQPLYSLGCDSVIVVHLDRKTIINKDNFKGMKIYEICPQNDLGGLRSGILNFKPEKVQELIEQGYADAKKVLESVIQSSQIGSASNKIYDNIQNSIKRIKQLNKEGL